MEKNTELQGAFQDLWDVIKKMTLQLEGFHKKRNDLQSQVDFLDDAIVLKNNKIKVLETEIANLQKTINDKNERITNQHAEIDSLLLTRDKSISLEDLYFNATSENDNLKKKVAELTHNNVQLKELEQNYTILQNAKETLEKENLELIQKTEKLDNILKNNEIAQNEIKNIKKEIINRNEQINKLRINISEQESVIISKNKELKQLFDDKINLNNEIVVMRNETTNLGLQIETLEENFEQKEIKLESDKLSYLAVIEHLKQEILAYDKQKQINEQISIDKQSNTDNLLKLQEDNAILQKDLLALKNQNTILHSEIDTLKQQVLTYDVDFTEDRTNKDNEIKEILAETEHLTEIVAKLTNELESNKVDSQHISLENKELNLKVEALQGEINKAEKLSKAIEKMKQTNKEQASTIVYLQTELRSYKQRMYDADSLFADMHEIEDINETKQHKLEIDKLMQKNAELENKISELENQVNQVKYKELELPKMENNATENKTNKKEKEEIVSKINIFIDKLAQRM